MGGNTATTTHAIEAFDEELLRSAAAGLRPQEGSLLILLGRRSHFDEGSLETGPGHVHLKEHCAGLILRRIAILIGMHKLELRAQLLHHPDGAVGTRAHAPVGNTREPCIAGVQRNDRSERLTTAPLLNHQHCIGDNGPFTRKTVLELPSDERRQRGESRENVLLALVAVDNVRRARDATVRSSIRVDKHGGHRRTNGKKIGRGNLILIAEGSRQTRIGRAGLKRLVERRRIENGTASRTVIVRIGTGTAGKRRQERRKTGRRIGTSQKTTDRFQVARRRKELAVECGPGLIADLIDSALHGSQLSNEGRKLCNDLRTEDKTVAKSSRGGNRGGEGNTLHQ